MFITNFWAKKKALGQNPCLEELRFASTSDGRKLVILFIISDKIFLEFLVTVSCNFSFASP